MGLKKAYIQKQNQFTVNASDAGMLLHRAKIPKTRFYTNINYFSGTNILYVGMLGPKGPCEELFIKHTGHQNYQVNYLCKDRGGNLVYMNEKFFTKYTFVSKLLEYLIIIKYGNEDIPGTNNFILI